MLYEVVVSKGRAGADYLSFDSLKEAREGMEKRAGVDDLFEMIFVRQYYVTRFGRETFRVLHRLTIHAPCGVRCGQAKMT